MKSLASRLVEEFQSRQAKNPRYSLRSYSRYLGVNPTSLSLYLRGRRNLSAQSQQRLQLRLGQSYPDLLALENRVTRYTPLDLEKMAVLGDWWYFAILSLCELKEFQSSPKWIAQRLNISTKKAKEAIHLLLKLNMLKRDAHQRLRTTGRRFVTPDQVVNLSVRRSHYQALELARESLDRDPLEKRGFYAVTLAADPARVAEAHRRGKAFCRRLSNFLDGGEKTEVYRIALQIFPLSRDKAKK